MDKACSARKCIHIRIYTVKIKNIGKLVHSNSCNVSKCANDFIGALFDVVSLAFLHTECERVCDVRRRTAKPTYLHVH